MKWDEGSMGHFSDRDESHLRRAIALAEEAVESGRRPFGALVVAQDGSVVAEATSDQQGDRDWTAHAEIKAIRAAGQVLSWSELERATLYASSDPCPMCAGSMYWSNLRRVVYGLGEAGMRSLRSENAKGRGLEMSCREVLARSSHPIEVIGPVLEDAAIVAHRRYWTVHRPAEGWVGADKHERS
jgi:tRNA(adenine34) deaminase